MAAALLLATPALASETVPLVRIAPVQRMTLSDSFAATGITQPDHQTVLSFKTGGVIARIAVNPGDHVHKNQVLAELDPRDLDAALRQALGAHDKALRDLARYERLHKAGAVAEVTYDDALTQESTTRAAADAAIANRAYGELTAPNDGTVLSRDAEPAAVVAAGSAVLTISNEATSDVLRTGVSDRDVLKLRLGDPAEIRFSALPRQIVHANVSEIGRQADVHTGVFMVKLAISGAPERLAAGLIGEARIYPASRARRVIVIPAAALIEANGADGSVLVADRRTSIAHRRHVALGEVLDNGVEITGGLAPGEYVITDGAIWVDDGQHFAVGRP
jgi:RND family efflux transporter MFP subunit